MSKSRLFVVVAIVVSGGKVKYDVKLVPTISLGWVWNGSRVFFFKPHEGKGAAAVGVEK